MDAPPHVLILPFPAQGHVKPMLTLAELLCHAGLHVTFINTDHNHHNLRRSSSAPRPHRLRFASIPGVHRPNITDLFFSVMDNFKPKFRDLVVSMGGPPPTCIIADGIMAVGAVEVGEERGIPVICFRTQSACSTWTYLHLTKLIEDGEIPFSGETMDLPITSIPGLENLFRRRDLPSICRIGDLQNPIFQFFVTQTSAMTRASALILHTFQNLEAAIIAKLGAIFPTIYPIGPLHALLKAQITDHPSPSDSGSLIPQDRSCLTWLDSQPSRSVVYVSFGSLAKLTRGQFLEFLYGLVNSGKPFLWVVRSDLVLEEDRVDETPEELMVATRERGCLVDWAPQEEVLAHWAVGGFLTHSGWNSTVESILAGVPMICWPQIADQQVNSRCASELWRIGVDMKDTCDRSTVEKMVRDLMEDKREEIMKSTAEISRMARDSVEKGGSSHSALEKLIEDIKSMKFGGHVSVSDK
ncbi:7-deoxyloganetic acid glucosyltransferase [Actinidia chinensis var. chinensis]|uniref:Glycosyltransferase n=1 Tax=Actinidia chinensis var. chinensis TaxID=1590841 RepID=A0A2R6RX56_ACTCC|nr:7-deoxyloganetic acid glucosyltransferase [Actinidia chinensis var. chinensis]